MQVKVIKALVEDAEQKINEYVRTLPIERPITHTSTILQSAGLGEFLITVIWHG